VLMRSALGLESGSLFGIDPEKRCPTWDALDPMHECRTARCYQNVTLTGRIVIQNSKVCYGQQLFHVGQRSRISTPLIFLGYVMAALYDACFYPGDINLDGSCSDEEDDYIEASLFGPGGHLQVSSPRQCRLHREALPALNHLLSTC